MRELTNFGVNALWQAPLFALLAFAAAAMTKKLPPAHRAWIWFAGLAAAGTLPAWSVWKIGGVASLGSSVFVLRSEAVAGSAATGRINWTAVLILSLIAMRLIYLFAGWLRLRNLRLRSQGRVILRDEEAVAPFTFGSARPLIVVPVTLWSAASAGLRRAILAHERAHVRRRDYLWNLLAELATSAVWWHPAVWWLKSRYAVEREFACDEQAAQRVPGYARHVLEAAQLIAGRAPGLALGLFDSNVLEERMMKLIERPLTRPGSWRARALQFGAILTLVVAAVFIAHHPVALAAPEKPVYRITDGVIAPRLVEKVEPSYTEAARDAKITGVSKLFVIISEEGVADHISVLGSLDPGLDQQAMDAVARWKFTPAMKDGVPVRVQATVEINFRLF